MGSDSELRGPQRARVVTQIVGLQESEDECAPNSKRTCKKLQAPFASWLEPKASCRALADRILVAWLKGQPQANEVMLVHDGSFHTRKFSWPSALLSDSGPQLPPT